MRPFEGIRILDVTHVLAGPFAAYQLAVLGADVIKIEDPNEPDQSREMGADPALNAVGMGTAFMTQGSNKRSITLDLKTPAGQEALKKLAATADVLVENYRPGAFEALGLGYAHLAKVNPALIYASMTAYGHTGPRREQTAYDHVIQASSGIMAGTGTAAGGPTKVGTPVLDYATGTMAAFAISAALFQRARTGRGQQIDVAMLDVALMMQASLITGYMHSGHHPKPMGNDHAIASSSAYETADGMLMLGATNRRQHRRIFAAIGRDDIAAAEGLADRSANREQKAAALANALAKDTADAWENRLQAAHIPAARVRTMGEALADPQLHERNVLHRHSQVAGIEKPVTVPMAAFRFAHGGPALDRPPTPLGADTETVMAETGLTPEDIAALKAGGAFGKM